MPKYRRIPDIVDVEIYKEGTEDGWCVDYSGNSTSYYAYFNTKQESLSFINEDKGKEMCDDEDKNYEITYENPIPFIKTNTGEYEVFEGDFIILDEEGKRLRVIQPNILHMNYELVEE